MLKYVDAVNFLTNLYIHKLYQNIYIIKFYSHTFQLCASSDKFCEYTGSYRNKTNIKLSAIKEQNLHVQYLQT